MEHSHSTWWIWLLFILMLILLVSLAGILGYFIHKFARDIEQLNRSQNWFRRHSTWRIPLHMPKTRDILRTIGESDPLNATNTLQILI